MRTPLSSPPPYSLLRVEFELYAFMPEKDVYCFGVIRSCADGFVVVDCARLVRVGPDAEEQPMVTGLLAYIIQDVETIIISAGMS